MLHVLYSLCLSFSVSDFSEYEACVGKASQPRRPASPTFQLQLGYGGTCTEMCEAICAISCRRSAQLVSIGSLFGATCWQQLTVNYGLL